MNKRMKWTALILGLYLFSCGPNKDDQFLPQGKFKIVAIEFGRNDLFADPTRERSEFMQSTIVIANDVWTLKKSDGDLVRNYTLDFSNHSGSITFFDSQKKGEWLGSGIFRHNGHSITLCVNDFQKEGTPTNFVPRPKTRDVLLSIERINE